jgi:thiol-disulfide isomerase/thioredoxin
MNFRKLNIFILVAICTITFSTKANAQYFSDGKPVFVEISTEWCFACKMLKPVVEQLKTEYVGKVNFVSLDPGSEENLIKSQALAQGLGISDFFNANRNAFPTVGILCSSSVSPEKLIVGANPIESYRLALNTTLISSGFCSLNNSSQVTNNSNNEEQERPKETDFPQILTTRPDETTHSGRPDELKFWKQGEEVPASEYYKFLILPKCSPGNNIVCSNAVAIPATPIAPIQNTQLSSSNNGSAPVFKPWNPNATRNEKGFITVGKK